MYTADSLRMETIDGGVFICAFSDIVRIAKEKVSVYAVKIQDDELEPKRTWRPKGYQGTFEYGRSYYLKNASLLHNSFFTVHGYQLNSYLFIGGGIGIEQAYYKGELVSLYVNDRNLPLFASIKLTPLNKRISPYLDVRYGYAFICYKDMYFNASVGADVGITPRIGGFLGLGINMQKYTETTEQVSSKKWLNSMFIRLGLHF